VDRRRTSLLLLFVFIGCTGAAILIGGGRPAGVQGLAPYLVQAVGSVCALVAAGLLRLVCLVLTGMATARLAVETARSRRPR
jgi:hypothetical protein